MCSVPHGNFTREKGIFSGFFFKELQGAVETLLCPNIMYLFIVWCPKHLACSGFPDYSVPMLAF